VRDTGIGIPEDKIGMLFDKFTQVDASTTRKYGGTGLGLAISKQLAEMMGGAIGATSQEGKGSEFWFSVRLGKQQKACEPRGSQPAALRGVRALIVDDNATSRGILTTRMTSWDMRPSEAEDGPAGLQAFYRALEENDPFRLALIDAQMSGMDGQTLGRTIKADPRIADTQMVMLTSIGNREDTRQFMEIGFASYATKPIRPQELLDVIVRMLAGAPGVSPGPTATAYISRERWQPLAGCKARILLAEDNITNQQVALGMLKKLGLRADPVADGAETVKALACIPYDLVLMDVQMPVMDGIEATRQIRNLQSEVRNHTIPIIAMTAHAMETDRQRCLAAGMNDYLSKPVSPQALADALLRWLPRENGELTGIAEEPAPCTLPASVPVVFDRTLLLERLMGDEDLARGICEGFLDDIPAQIEALRRHLDAGDASGVGRQAHTLKGASAAVGGEALRSLSFEIEKAGKAGDLDFVAARMDDLERQFIRLREAITRDA
jgi:CheY-like chemotaxis protein/HPt (histidine-containing phosphotransfer) domain-containing protein